MEMLRFINLHLTLSTAVKFLFEKVLVPTRFVTIVLNANKRPQLYVSFFVIYSIFRPQ